jgi:hypothetical protein
MENLILLRNRAFAINVEKSNYTQRAVLIQQQYTLISKRSFFKLSVAEEVGHL